MVQLISRVGTATGLTRPALKLSYDFTLGDEESNCGSWELAIPARFSPGILRVGFDLNIFERAVSLDLGCIVVHDTLDSSVEIFPDHHQTNGKGPLQQFSGQMANQTMLQHREHTVSSYATRGWRKVQRRKHTHTHTQECTMHN